MSLERDFKDGAEIKKMETLRIRHVITPRFCKLPRKCLLPAGIKLVFFLSSHLRLWYWIVIEFLGGTVSWKVNSRLIEKLLVALDSVFFCDGLKWC